jgi:hypothetical protein
MKSLTKLCLVVFLALFITTLPIENAEAGIFKTIGKGLTFIPKTVYKGVRLLVEVTTSADSNPDGTRAAWIKVNGRDINYIEVRPNKDRIFYAGLFYTPADVVPVRATYSYAGRNGSFSLIPKKWSGSRRKREYGKIKHIGNPGEFTLTVQIWGQRIERRTSKETGLKEEHLAPGKFLLAERQATVNFLRW